MLLTLEEGVSSVRGIYAYLISEWRESGKGATHSSCCNITENRNSLMLKMFLQHKQINNHYVKEIIDQNIDSAHIPTQHLPLCVCLFCSSIYCVNFSRICSETGTLNLPSQSVVLLLLKRHTFISRTFWTSSKLKQTFFSPRNIKSETLMLVQVLYSVAARDWTSRSTEPRGFCFAKGRARQCEDGVSASFSVCMLHLLQTLGE